MSDPIQTRAIRLQSTALILAALITTAGAISSAVIQSGWLGKPATQVAAAVTHSVAPKPLAAFVGTLEPLDDRPIFSTPASSSPSPTPATFPAITYSKPLMGNSPAWISNIRPVTNNQPAEPAASGPKSSPWDSLSRFFGGRP